MLKSAFIKIQYLLVHFSYESNDYIFRPYYSFVALGGHNKETYEFFWAALKIENIWIFSQPKQANLIFVKAQETAVLILYTVY